MLTIAMLGAGIMFGDVWVSFVALCLIFGILLSLVRWRMKPRLG